MQKLTPDSDQQAAIQKIRANEAAMVASTTGTGKSLVCVEAMPETGTVLVVCPISVMLQWADAIKAQRPGAHVHVIEAKDKANKAYKALAAHATSTPDNELHVGIVGHEFFHIAATELKAKQGTIISGMATPSTQVRFINNTTQKSAGSTWADTEGRFSMRTTKASPEELQPTTLVTHLAKHGYTTRPRPRRWKWSTTPFDMVIVDESHVMKNKQSQFFKVAKTLKTAKRVAASATPGGDDFEGLWAPCRWLWPDVIDGSHYRWKCEWMDYDYDPFTRMHRKFTKEKNPGEFVQTLPCYIRTEREELPYEHDYLVKLEMTPPQRKQYDEMEAKGLTWLEENPLVADLPLTQKIRLRQMCLGEVTQDPDTGVVSFDPDCPSSFIAAAKKITERHPGEKILFLTNSNSFAHVLAERLGPRAAAWTGSETQAQRKDIKTRFTNNTNEPLDYIVGTISKAIAVGTDGLQHVCRIEVWLGKSLESTLNEQAAGRLNRRGQPAESLIRYELRVPGTAQDDDFALDARKFLQRKAELAKL